MFLLEMTYFIAQNKLADRLPLGLEIGDTPVSLLKKPEVITLLEKRIAEFSNHPIQFEFENQIFEIAPTEINLQFEITKKIDLLSDKIVNFGRIDLPVKLNEKRLRRLLLSRFPELEFSATDAKVFLDKSSKLEILPEKNGNKTDFEKIAEEVKKIAGRFSSLKIVIESEPIKPKIFAKDLESFRIELEKIIAEKLILKKTNYERFEIDLAKRVGWFGFNDGEVFLKRSFINKFIEKELNPLLVELPHDVTISRTLKDEITFEGIAKNGLAIDKDSLFTKMEVALENDWHEIEIPFQILSAPVKISTELADRGIIELIGEAVTNYDGSPENRQHNIRVAAEKLNGQIIEAGTEFSFVDYLGLVTLSNGYRRELVIKEGNIVPEIGGGVCQVSTTFFRTALDAGVPITAQKPHSMKVSYYDPPGLDATVYPGSADLRFLNDTNSPILIQTAVENSSLRVNFFGMKDGRKVKITGPFYPNGDPVTNLRLAGMRMFWTREVAKNGETTISERYSANYKLMPIH